MKRLHVHVGVTNLVEAITYYSAMFGEEPVKTMHDYAKWSPSDLGVNFAISLQSEGTGIGHLGVEVDEDDDLVQLRGRLKNVNAHMYDEGEVKCCYAQSRKVWSEDPAGVQWELFNTIGESDQLAPEPVKS